MNWYKKANKAVKVPQYLYRLADLMADKIIEAIIFIKRYYLAKQNFPEKPIDLGYIKIPNGKNVSFHVNNYFDSTFSAYYDIASGKIAFNISQWTISTSTSELDIINKKTQVKDAITHELTHILDPKPDDIKRKFNPQGVPRAKRPVELESYSRGTIDIIGRAYKNGNDQDRANIRKWLQFYHKSNVLAIPEEIRKSLGLGEEEYKIIKEWKNIDEINNALNVKTKRKTMFRLFLTKLWHEIQIWDKQYESNNK